MPLTAGHSAMRKYYDPNWAMHHDEQTGEKRKYKVTVDYTYTCEDSYTGTFEAYSAEEAEELACQAAEEQSGGDDFDVLDVCVKETGK